MNGTRAKVALLAEEGPGEVRKSHTLELSLTPFGDFRPMTPRTLGPAEAVNVILSEAKNLVASPDAADMPRSFAALRMTVWRIMDEKIDRRERRGHWTR